MREVVLVSVKSAREELAKSLGKKNDKDARIGVEDEFRSKKKEKGRTKKNKEEAEARCYLPPPAPS